MVPKCKLFGHKWNGCKCEKCGQIRDTEHAWDGCKCKKCGKIRDEGHNWKEFKCVICGKELTLSMSTGNGQKITVDDTNVDITGRIIPISTIIKTVFYPAEYTRPLRGGCIKFVTEECPSLPERNGHSFEVPCAKDDISGKPYTGAGLPLGNCYWFNCAYSEECDDVNKRAMEIKEYIDGCILCR